MTSEELRKWVSDEENKWRAIDGALALDKLREAAAEIDRLTAERDSLVERIELYRKTIERHIGSR